MLIPPEKPKKVRVGVNMPCFPGDKPTMTILGPAESECIKINPNFPFYKLMKYLSALNSLESLDLISRKNLQDAYEDIIVSLPQKIIWKGENLAKFPAARQFMFSQFFFFSKNLKLSTNSTAVLELSIYVFQKIYAISSQMKNNIKTDMQTIISDFMCTIPLMYEKVEKNSQLAESWARKALQHLESLPIVDANDIKKRKFFVQMQLAIIYFQMGYTENAIYWLKTIKESYRNFYYAESKDMFGLMVRGYQTVMHGLFDKDSFETMMLGRDFHDLLEIFKKGLTGDVVNSKMTHEEYSEIFAVHHENILQINSFIEKAKQNHAAQFLQIKNDSKHFDLVSEIKFVLPKDNVLLKFSESVNHDHVQKSFEKNKVKYQMLGGSSTKLFVVSMYACSIRKLQKICQYTSHLENLVTIKKQEELNRANILSSPSEVTQIGPLESSPSRQISLTTCKDETALYSKPLFAVEESANATKKNSPEKVLTNKANMNKPSVPVVQPAPVIQYDWLSAGMSYCSSNKDNIVKPLSQSSCDIWYGYIAPWVLEDNLFNPEFLHRLANAKLSHDCIRDITKELLTWNNQNFSKDHPYKFKIVIPKHDNRLYGWIEDCCKDSKGKMHYLICFGFMGHHKTKFLPDPENIKRKFTAGLNSDKPVGETVPKAAK